MPNLTAASFRKYAPSDITNLTITKTDNGGYIVSVSYDIEHVGAKFQYVADSAVALSRVLHNIADSSYFYAPAKPAEKSPWSVDEAKYMGPLSAQTSDTSWKTSPWAGATEPKEWRWS